MMKKIEATISAGRLDEVREALSAGEIDAMTASQVNVYNGKPGHVEMYRGARYQIDFHARVKVELTVADEQVRTVVEILERAGRTDLDGDEVILILGIDDFTRIEAVKRGAAAAIFRSAHVTTERLTRPPSAISA
jgi:nitrogen regulatory protein PII